MQNKIIYLGANPVRNIFADKSTFDSEGLELFKPIFNIYENLVKENSDLYLKIKNSNASLLVVDLYSLNFPYYDKNNIKRNLFEEVEFTYEVLESMADKFLQIFSKEQIVLIDAKRANFFISNNTLIKNAIKCEEFNKRIDDYQRYFVEKTGCSFINISRTYFADRDSVWGISPINYENSYYYELRCIIAQILEKKIVICVSESAFKNRLTRFITLCTHLQDSLRQYLILDKDNNFEAFLAQTSGEFLSKYKNNICEIHKTNWPPQKGMSVFMNQPQEIKDLHKYSVLFDYKMLLIRHVIKLAQKKINEYIGEGLLVTENNLFDVLNFLLNKKDIYFQNLASNQPIKIDIWGSCVSREVFKECSNDLYLNNYIYRNNPIHVFGKTVPVSNSLFLEENFNGSKWRMGVLRDEMYRNSKTIINNSDSNWIIVDLYDIVENCFTIQDVPFIADWDTQNMQIFDLLKHDYDFGRLDPLSYSDTYIAESLDKYINLLKHHYGKNIILINVFFNKYYVNANGEIKKFELGDNYETLINKKNLYLKKWQDYVSQNLDCYVINISKFFLGDEKFVWGASPVHYEKPFQENVARIIDYIIINKPANRLFDNYDREDKIKRVIRMKKPNTDMGVFVDLFYEDDVDKILVSLSSEEANQYVKDLTQIYSNSFKTVDEVLSNYNFTNCNSLKEILIKRLR